MSGPPSGQSLGYNTFKTAIPKLNPPNPLCTNMAYPNGRDGARTAIYGTFVGHFASVSSVLASRSGPTQYLRMFLALVFLFRWKFELRIARVRLWAPRGPAAQEFQPKRGPQSEQGTNSCILYVFGILSPCVAPWAPLPDEASLNPSSRETHRRAGLEAQNSPEERQQGPAHGPEAPVAHPMAQEGTQNQQPAAPAPADAVEPRGRVEGSF